MKHCVFIGNGINRLNKSNPSWSELLNVISGKSTHVVDSIPNTLLYESKIISNYNLVSSSHSGIHSVEYNVKESLSRCFEKYTPNEIYDKLALLPIHDFITTNYDHALDEAIINAGYVLSQMDHSESRFSIHRNRTYINQFGDIKRIWAIHGDYIDPRSILLGYEQYGGQLRKIAEYLNGQYTIGRTKVPSIKVRVYNLDKNISSWIDLFFCSNIYFIGFGLPYDEIDLWWLLCKRKKLMMQHPDLLIDNNLLFLEPNIEDGKRKILEDLSVTTLEYKTDDPNYLETYRLMLEDISKEISVNIT